MEKVIIYRLEPSLLRLFAFLGLIFLVTACNGTAPEMKTEVQKEEAPIAKETIWHIKAVHPEGRKH